MATEIDMKKFNELQEKITKWKNKTITFKEKCEFELKRMEASVKMVIKKHGDLSNERYGTVLGNWIYEGKNEIDKLKKNIKEYKEMLNCEHESILEDLYVGHDSHKDYYETRCNKCKAVIDNYSY